MNLITRFVSFGIFLLAVAMIAPRAMGAADLWAFPETMTDPEWSFLAVPSTEEADKTSPMDGKPEMLNPTAGRKGTYFLKADPLTQISDICVHPGNNHDAVLVWTATKTGKAKIKASWYPGTPASEESKVSIRVEKMSRDGGTSKLKDETFNHNKSVKMEVDVDVREGDRIAFRLGNGGDGPTCDSTNFTVEILLIK